MRREKGEEHIATYVKVLPPSTYWPYMVGRSGRGYGMESGQKGPRKGRPREGKGGTTNRVKLVVRVARGVRAVDAGVVGGSVVLASNSVVNVLDKARKRVNGRSRRRGRREDNTPRTWPSRSRTTGRRP